MSPSFEGMNGKRLGKKRLLSDLAVAASIVTLVYIDLIRNFLFVSKEDAYYLPTYGFLDYLTAVVLILGMSILCFLAIRKIREINSSILNLLSSFLIFLALLNPMLFIIASISGQEYHPEGLVYQWIIVPKIVKVIVVLIALIGLGVFVKFYWRLFRAARIFFLITSPFAALVILQLMWHAITAFSIENDLFKDNVEALFSPIVQSHQSDKPSRVLVVVFDELDYRLVFEERPAAIRLLEFDRLTEQAIKFTNVPSVSIHTKEAIPTLLVGKKVLRTTILDKETLLLHFNDAKDSQSLSSMPNLFSQVHQSGRSLSIAGVYHPYCRLFRELYKECLLNWRTEGPLKSHESNHDLLRRMQSMFLEAFPYPPYTVAAIWRYGVILQRIKEMVGRFDVDLIFLHIMLPHKPIIFDGHRERMTPFNYSPWGYFDNLALTDKCLGELRRVLENTGLWDNTTVLVTSDHPWRKAKKYTGKSDKRVPILLKMPNQQRAVVYEKEFPPMRVKDLVLRILERQLVDPNMVIEWAEKQEF
jgi:hypothetical protein